MLNSDISPTCRYNMVHFGPVTAEIRWRVWGTPANFNGFRVLAALLHGTLVVGVSQALRRRNRGHHLYSAGRPSRWAFAHILVSHDLSTKPQQSKGTRNPLPREVLAGFVKIPCPVVAARSEPMDPVTSCVAVAFSALHVEREVSDCTAL